MDEFAQSREDDDLFADEFEPIPTPAAVTEPSNQAYIEPREPVAYNGASSKPAQNNRRGGGERQDRGGRGGRGKRGAGGGLGDSRYAPKAEQNVNAAAPKPQSAQTETLPTPAPAPQSSTAPALANVSSEAPPLTDKDEAAATATPLVESILEVSTAPEAATQTTGRTPAVRGDRSLTGGPSKKKLTEEELTQKMEKMAILNAQKSEKHRLTELDQAQFQNREKEMAKERREREQRERRERAGMEAERMRNRERKLKGMGGREWDEGKEEMIAEEGRRGRGGSEYVRGGHGGVIRGRGAGLSGSRFAGENGEENGTGRGRGGFDIRGRGARGGRGGGNTKQNLTKDEEFPSLPPATKNVDPPVLVSAKEFGYSAAKPAEKVDLKNDKPHDWAEEMATPVEAAS